MPSFLPVACKLSKFDLICHFFYLDSIAYMPCTDTLPYKIENFGSVKRITPEKKQQINVNEIGVYQLAVK